MSTDKLTPLGLLTIFVGLKKTGCGQIAVRMLSGRDCEVTSAANLLTDLRLSLRSLTVPFVYVTLPTPTLPSPGQQSPSNEKNWNANNVFFLIPRQSTLHCERSWLGCWSCVFTEYLLSISVSLKLHLSLAPQPQTARPVCKILISAQIMFCLTHRRENSQLYWIII